MYGDLLWVASPGVLVYPDFFHLFSPCKGMHGYNPVHVDSFGTCIHYGYDISARVTEVSHLTSVFDLLKDSVGLD